MDGSVFGPHRRERIAFLAENGQAWLKRRKAGPKRSKPVHFSEKGLKNTPKMDGRKRVWTAQVWRIVFSGKFGEARHGHLKKELGRSKKTHFIGKR